jgi:glycosyltransferase involved in cell wall biosynthesis
MPPRLVYLAPVDWHSFAQRPHQYVRWWHGETGGHVLWVNPYPARLPRWSDLARLRQAPVHAGPGSPPWLRVVQPPAWPIEPLPGAGAVLRGLWRPVLREMGPWASAAGSQLVIGKPSRMALQVAQALPFARKTYDAMDDFPAFHRGRAARLMAELERAIVAQVDTVWASSSTLLAKFRGQHARVKPVLNGLDLATIPPPLGPAAATRPQVLGYVGTIREWFDWQLLLRIAHTAPRARIRLIGPLDHPCPEPLPANVECLPACSHPVALEHMRRFSAGLIPFQLNRLTQAVDPIKYYEYAALGLPVLTTPFGEMAHRGRRQGVFHLDPTQDPQAAMDAALAWQPDAASLAAFRQANGWDARFRSAEPRRRAFPQQPAVAPEHA